MDKTDIMFSVRDRVEKTGGDYTFEGEVVARFHKRSGKVRYVVEDDRGVLHIYNGTQLRHMETQANG